MMLVDTSGILASLGRDQPFHQECEQALAQAQPPLLLSPFVLAELDCLISKRLDQRHFRVVPAYGRQPFRILPADE